ncbi:MAG: twitching motility protein PilT [Actinomycetota bacterium]|jgi:twitching motility protein PilT|nr:twitching motility protein PilT [Actinomycetota bacterium]
MAQVQKQLGDVLLERGMVTAEQLNFATQEEQRTGTSAWKVLMERGILTEKDLVRAQAAQVGMEFVDVRSARPPAEVLRLLPQEAAQRQVAMPIRLEGKHLTVAMAEPTNHLAIEEISRLTGCQVSAAAGHRPDLIEVIPLAYERALSGVADDGPVTTEVASFGPDDLPMTEAPAAPAAPVHVVEEGDKEPNLADFLIAVIEGEASDLHLTGGLPPMMRTHGELAPIKGFRRLLPKDLQEIIYSMLTQKQREQFEENLELDISYQLPGKARFRVNVFQQRDALGAVMRRIPFEIKNLDELGLPPSVKELANLRRGLVLVTGITGSGKSTTLAGLIDIVNSERAEHIMTVEDPIEFLHKHKKAVVNQREIGSDTHGFAQALKHVLRQDPDVILVGEMRDLETISAALTAAETGHLVFGTLHTQDAPQSVDRVIDVFPPHQQQQIRVQLAGTLAGVVSQQLLPTADKKGRVVAAEVLIATPAVRNLIREGKTHQIYTSMQAGGKYGMQVMDQALGELVKRGRITYEMGLERSHHVEEFTRIAGKG